MTALLHDLILNSAGRNPDSPALTFKTETLSYATLADIVIKDTYFSKMHALLQVYSNAVVLHDLNSTNGTTVNSQTTLKSVLRNDDVITLGHYRLKVENLPVGRNEGLTKVMFVKAVLADVLLILVETFRE